MYNILANKNLVRLLNSKEPWFNNTIPSRTYRPISPDKDGLPQKVLDYIANNGEYIHKIKKDTVSGLASVLANYSCGIRSIQVCNLLIRGYTHDWRIIIYILLTTGFTLWFNLDPCDIPQIEYTSNLFHNSFLYQVSHLIMNLEKTNAELIPSSSCFISKIPSYISENVISTNFHSIEIAYVKETFNNGWSQLPHIRPNELVNTIFELESKSKSGESLGFDPLKFHKHHEEALEKANLDWESTVESHNRKRVKSYLFCSGILILLMILVESTPGSIAA